MASERVVRILLTGDSAGLVRALSVAGGAAEVTKTKLERMQSVGRGMSSIGRQMTTLAVPLVALGGYAIKSSMNYQQALTRIQTQTGATAAEVAKQGKNLQGLNVGFDTTQLAEGLYPIESEGLRGTDALKALTAAAKGAKIGGDSLTSTADAMAGVMGVNAKDIHSAAEAMNVMDKTVGLGKMHLEDLTAAMSTGVTSEAANMGLGFRDIGAALSAMTRQGVPAEIEASRMKLTLSKMAAPAGGALKALQSIGLSQFTLAKDLQKPHGLVVALQDLQGHLSGLGENQRNAVLSAAFGQSRGLANVTGLLRSLPVMTGIRGQLDQATGASFGKRWGEQMQTPAQKFANMIAKVKTSVTNLGTALMPIVLKWLPKVVSLITSAVHWFSGLPKPIKNIVMGFTAFLAIGGPILIFFGAVVTAIGTIGTALSFLAANPVILTIAALVAVGVALVELYRHSKTFRDGLKAVGQAVVGVFNGIKAFIVGAANFIGRHWKLLGSVLAGPFVALPMFVASHFQQVKHWVGDAIGWIGHAFAKVFSILTWPFREAFKVIKRIVGSIASIPGHLLHGAGSVLHTLSFGLLHGGGPVRAQYMAGGGPVGSDTVPGWLTPGEYVLDKATTSRVGLPALRSLQAGGEMGGNITIVPAPFTIKLDSRTLAEGVVRYTVGRAARGPSSLVGGSFAMGSATA